MREILFRGKLKARNEWAEGNLHIDSKGVCIITPDETLIGKYGQVAPETVGQYTGLTDKNGNKIFEGDILRSTSDYDDLWGDTKECVEIGVVFWDDETFGWSVRMDEDDVVSLAEFVEGDTTIIGNKHDNPELLGEELPEAERSFDDDTDKNT